VTMVAIATATIQTRPLRIATWNFITFSNL
jgi:hypothetical protein